MQITLRIALPEDFEFAFEAKRLALGPHIAMRWGWDLPTCAAMLEGEVVGRHPFLSLKDK